MEGFSAIRGSGFRVLADYLVIHSVWGEKPCLSSSVF
jgi:hypothetical protein